jgi:hypothetical protein
LGIAQPSKNPNLSIFYYGRVIAIAKKSAMPAAPERCIHVTEMLGAYSAMNKLAK